MTHRAHLVRTDCAPSAHALFYANAFHLSEPHKKSWCSHWEHDYT
jgi:hypothetical protein